MAKEQGDEMQIDGGAREERVARAIPEGFNADYLKIYYGDNRWLDETFNFLSFLFSCFLTSFVLPQYGLSQSLLQWYNPWIDEIKQGNLTQ